MKVFISWSGDQSYSLAECLTEWLPSVIQRARPFISTGISKGARWSTVIASELEDTDFGILCVTSDNIDAPWLLFEAGAISKSLDHAKVAPLLIGTTKDALSGSPLAQFQLSELARDDMLELVKSLNEADADRLEDRRLEEAFDAFWPRFETAIGACGLSTAPPAAASLAQTSSNARAAEGAEPGAEPDTPEARIRDASASDIEAIASEVERTEEFRSEPDFFTALLANRRHELGATGETESVRSLHDRDPASFWPRYFLARQDMAAGDLGAASETIRSLPPAKDARSRAHVEDLNRDLASQLSEVNDGLQHIRTVLTGAASDGAKASTIESFATKHATSGPDVASCMLREFALRLDPSDQNVRFNLAHKLADRRSSSAAAYDQYERVRASRTFLGPKATHNMGVIASSRGMPALMYERYEEAESEGIALSSINLAESMISSGNLRGAREALGRVKDPFAYRQNYDAAKQRLSSAEARLAQDEKALIAAAKSAHSDFSRFSDVCVRSWIEGHKLRPGVYSLAGKGLSVRVDGERAVSASLTRNGRVEAAALQSNGLCQEGLLVQKGATAGALSRSLLATPSNADGVDLLALLWGGPLPNEPAELMELGREQGEQPSTGPG